MPRTASTKKRRRGWAWTLTIIAALLAVVWVGSTLVLVHSIIPPRLQVDIYGGCIRIQHYAGTLVQGVEADPFVEPDLSVRVRPRWSINLWFYTGTIQPGSLVVTRWSIPLWPFILLTGVPGVWMLIKTRTPTNPHACPACGYDRTGLPQSPTGPAPCPECGKGRVGSGEWRMGEEKK